MPVLKLFSMLNSVTPLTLSFFLFHFFECSFPLTFFFSSNKTITPNVELLVSS